MSNTPRICAVIPARNVATTISNVLWHLHRAHVTHCVPVINGCTDETYNTLQNVLKRLPMTTRPVHIASALGPDVPRAIGAYQALRSFPEVDWFLFVDGDWAGSFGPMMEDTLSLAIHRQVDVQFVPRQEHSGVAGERTDFEVWNTGLRHQDEVLWQASPSEAPLIIHRRIFQWISPRYLYHPGIWFALVVRQRSYGLHFGTAGNWSGKLTGNPSPSIIHARKMQETLIGDALEGARLLLQQKPHRRWRGVLYDGYNSARRIDVLEKWQSSTFY